MRTINRTSNFSLKKNDNNIKLSKIILFLGLIFLGTIILSGAVSAAGLADSPQPKFHHNNNSTGQSQYIGPKTNDTKWNYTTGNAVDSSPAIDSNGTIYAGSVDGNFYALYPNGTQKWSYSLGNTIYSSPAIGSDGTIYIGGMDGNLYALNPDGTLNWTFTTGDSIYGSPAIASDGTIYIGSWDNYMYAVNPNGTQKWRYRTGGQIWDSPAIASDGSIYFGSFDQYLYGLTSAGTLKMQFRTGERIFGSPAIGSDGTIYFGSWDNNFYAVNQTTGAQIWQFTTGGPISSSPAIDNNGTIYFGSDDNNLYALNPNGTQKWIFTALDYIEASPTIGSDGTIYIGSDDFNMYALNPNGTQKWVYATGLYILGSPAIGSDGTLYFGSDDFNLYALEDLNASANPAGGLYNTTQMVTLTTNQNGTIYYTTNGTDPNTSSSVYSTPINISINTILKYLATNSAGTQSQIYTENYTIDLIPPTASANPVGGLYNSTKNVVLTMSEPGTIYYTTNGTDPTTSSPVYSTAVTISANTTLKYLAVDLAGNKSPIYTETYTLDTIAPTVTSSTPVNNETNVAVNKIIQITFSEAIKFGTNPFIELKLTNGTGAAVPFTSSIIANILSITPNSLLTSGTQYTAIVHSNSIMDLAGNVLVAPFTTRFTTITPPVPPVITSTNPVNNTVNVATNSVIKFNFNQAIKLGTNPFIEFKNASGTAVPFTTSITGSTLNLTPTALLAYGTVYTVIVHSNAVTDLTGTSGLATSTTIKFNTTTPTAPVVISTNPVNNTVNVATNSVIKFNFNQAIKLGTNPFIEFKNASGTAVPFTTSITGSTLNLTPTSTLTKATKYTVIVHSNAVTNLTGTSGLATPTTIKFTTA